MSTEINLGGGGGGIGVQGIQGIQGTAGTGSQGLFAQIYITGNVAASAINTNQLVQNFTLDQANAINLVNFGGTNDALEVTEAGIYKVNARFHSNNGSATSEDISIACAVNGTFVTASVNNISNIEAGDFASTEFDVIINLNAGDRVNFYWRTTSLSLVLNPAILNILGYSVVINMINVAYVSQGIQGIQGLLGIQGTQGLQGLDGAFAAQGIQGTQGIQGIQGQIGTQGITGTGIQGIQGIQGVQGTDGLQGATGTGIQGIQGTTGATGNTGAQGVQGITGIQGADGIQGSVGLQGTQGIIGAQGIEGIQGATGNTGIQGATGTQGAIGIQGLQGLQGIQGLTGATGAGGAVGYYGSFYSTQDQTALAINTLTVATFNTTSLNNGINVVSNSQVTFANTGTYALNFSIQLDKISSGGGENFWVWLRKNGSDVADSATKYVVQSNYRFVVSSLDFLLDLNAGDFIEIAWSVDNTDIILEYDAGVSPYPAVPSIILNAFQVTYAIQGTQGTTGASGSTGAQGIQGIQGIDGIQGATGAQGTTGATGNTGLQGIQGITGIQGNTGIQGTQGIQGIQGIGNTGAQGIQGITGTQGAQGIQGLQGDPGVVGYYYSAYDTTTQIASAINTEELVEFNNTYASNSVTLTGTTQFRINEAAVYKVQCEIQYDNIDATDPQTGQLYVKVNGTALVGSTVVAVVAPSTAFSQTLEITSQFNAGDTIEFAFYVSSTNLRLTTAAASSPLPSKASAFANIAQVARTLGPLDGNIQLAWTSGYFNLTNSTDNQIPFNSSVFNVGAALATSNLSTSNAAVQFLYTGLYIVNVRAHLFDLGSNMILSTTLYTGTNGTTWAFSTTIGINRYEGVNTNQIQNTSFLIRVTSLPFYIQPRLQPSANAPFPADLGAPTAFSVTRVGDL
jgi:hypothetical protein